MGFVRQRTLFAAKDHQRVMRAMDGKHAVRPRPKDLDPRACLVQGDADLTVMGDFGILDDGDVHADPP